MFFNKLLHATASLLKNMWINNISCSTETFAHVNINCNYKYIHKHK